MKSKRIIGAVLALGLIVGGGFGFKALAQSNPSTQPNQTQDQFYPGGVRNGNFNGNFGGMMNGNFGGMMNGNSGGMMNGNTNGNFGGMMGGNFGGFMRGMRGFFSGGQGVDLTQEQEKEIISLRSQIQTVMVDYQDKMVQAREKLTGAIESGIKTDILTAWEELKVLHTEVQAKIKPITDQLAAILKTDQDYQKLMTENFENNYLNQQMEELKGANEEDSKKIIEDLQTGRGNYRGGRGMMNQKGGFGGFGGCRGTGVRP